MNAGSAASGTLRNLAGAAFAALLVWAPLNFGSTRAGGPELLAAGCAAATLLWAAAWICGGPAPQVQPIVVATATVLVVAVLPWSLGLYHATPVLPFTQAHFNRVAARWPSSIVWREPAGTAAFAIALAAAVVPLTDLARVRRWRLIFSGTLAATAVLVAGLALAQNFTHAPGIYWRDEGRLPGNFCGTFFHHTSAGAYFNTAWPLAFALTWLAWDRAPAARLRTAAAVAAGLGTVLLLAGHGSHVSRFPQAAALLVTPLLLTGLPARRNGRIAPGLLALGAVAAIVALIAVAGRTRDIATRWQLAFAGPGPAAAGAPPSPAEWPALMRADLFVPYTFSTGLLGVRLEGWRTALRSIADRPLTGHGPANWMGAASRHSIDPFVRTFYQFLQFAHQDTLQSAVELGLPAALAWWALLLGGALAAFRPARNTSRSRRLLARAAGCGLVAVLLQAQMDFPLQIPAVALNVAVLAALAWAGRVSPDLRSAGVAASRPCIT